MAVTLALPPAGTETLFALKATEALLVENDGVVTPPVESAFTDESA